MRRSQSEVTDSAEIRRILDSTNIGRLATVGQDGYPYITPVNFVRLEESIYFHCAPKGEKLDNLARDARVCFEVDVPLAAFDVGFDPTRPICQQHQLYHCVIVRGSAAVVEDEALKIEALNALVRKHEPGRDLPPVTPDMPGFKACRVIEIRPRSITAKSDLLQKAPEDLRKRFAGYLCERNQPGDRETVQAMGFHVSKPPAVQAD
jgi:uncharacterized protein